MTEELGRLEQLKAEYTNKLRRVGLVNAGVNIHDTEKYAKFITADNEQEISEQATGIAIDLNSKPKYVDPSSDTWTPFAE